MSRGSAPRPPESEPDRLGGLRVAAPPLFAAAAACATVTGLLMLVGVEPGRAARALYEGALGDRLALENTVVRSVPLLLLGLAVATAFRCGVWNIGGEGQLYVGALVATAFSVRAGAHLPTPLALPLTLVAGLVAGALWGGLAALLKITRGVSEVLSTILLNFVAVLAVAWAVHGPLQEAAAAYPQSDPLPDGSRLPLLPGFLRLHAGLLIAYSLPAVLFVWLFRAAGGMRLRAVGLSPDAARHAGISLRRETLRVLLLSGALAGLGGAVEVCGVTGRLFENLSSGYGFTAIAVALLARLHPLGAVPSALFFAALATGSGAMQRVAHVPSVTVQIIEALVILFSVGFALPRRGG